MSEATDAIKKAYKGKDVTVTEENGVIFIHSNKHEFFSALPSNFLTEDPEAPARLLRKWADREHTFPEKKKESP